MTLTQPKPRTTPKGTAAPRLAPPVPAKSLLKEFERHAKGSGIKLMPWQQIAARYLTATEGKRWRYRDVAIIVARQNGKTSLLLPRILLGLERGERILHTAQNRELPRETFNAVAALIVGQPDVLEIRMANGQQMIRMANGARYTLVAPRPGVRGHAVDTVILDEVREQRSFDLLAGIKPTLTASKNPQVIYLSNAGDSDSVVLNDLRRRADSDPSLAYLEWSAGPERAVDELEGWQEANPALGITIQLDTLEDMHRSLPRSVFETEHLCRWVITTQPRLVPEAAWDRLRHPLEKPLRPFMGISMDISGKRASAVIAWQQTDGSIAVKVIADVHGDPIDTDRLGKDIRNEAIKLGVTQVAYDPWSDTDLSRHFDNAKSLNGRDYANASENFARVVDSGRIRWDGDEVLSDDLGWTARRPYESGAWMAIKAKEDRPITSVLAAIRAVWLASGPKKGPPRIY